MRGRSKNHVQTDSNEQASIFFGFNAIAIKLWENMQLSFSNNFTEFDLTVETIFSDIIVKVDTTF